MGRLLTDRLTQLAAYAKANPGKLSYTSGLVGTSPQLSMEWLKQG